MSKITQTNGHKNSLNYSAFYHSTDRLSHIASQNHGRKSSHSCYHSSVMYFCIHTHFFLPIDSLAKLHQVLVIVNQLCKVCSGKLGRHQGGQMTVNQRIQFICIPEKRKQPLWGNSEKKIGLFFAFSTTVFLLVNNRTVIKTWQSSKEFKQDLTQNQFLQVVQEIRSWTQSFAERLHVTMQTFSHVVHRRQRGVFA